MIEYSSVDGYLKIGQSGVYSIIFESNGSYRALLVEASKKVSEGEPDV